MDMKMEYRKKALQPSAGKSPLPPLKKKPAAPAMGMGDEAGEGGMVQMLVTQEEKAMIESMRSGNGEQEAAGAGAELGEQMA